MGNWFRDFRYAARYLTKSSGFALVAVLTLALGIGANTAVFSLVHAVLFRPLPYPQADRLVLLWESAPFFGLHDSPVAPANYFDWKARSRSFEEIGALEERSYRLFGAGTPEIVHGSLVTPGCLRALGLRVALGRLFREEEDLPGSPKLVVVSDTFWRRQLGADPAIAGRQIRLNDEPYSVVGVLAPGQEPPTQYGSVLGEIWTTFGSVYSAKELADRGRHNWMVIGRLREGITAREADAEMKSIGVSLASEYPDTNRQVGAFVGPLRDHFVRSSRIALALLFATVTLVMLIACANIANLLLSRAAGRRREMAIRAALGAGTWQIVRQSLCESLLLCAAGSAAGILLASISLEFLARLAPGTLAGMKALTLDWRVLTFAGAVTCVTAVVFALTPLVRLRSLDANEGLKQSSRTLAGSSASRRLRTALVCSEVALAFLLLIGAGLLLRSFARIRGVDPGCRTDKLLTLQIPGPQQTLTQPQIASRQREILRRIRAVPGVVAAGFTNHIPLAFKGDVSGVGIDGRDPNERIQCDSRLAGPGYFRAMGIPIRRGRDMEETDDAHAPYVALVNETLARLAWPRRDPIGRRLLFGTNARATVVGVVGDVHGAGLEVNPKPEFYVSALQVGFMPGSLAIQTTVPANTLVRSVRDAIWSLDPAQPITDVATIEEILDSEVYGRRLQMRLLSGFAALALALACIGLYGVLAYQVSQSIPEIGVRIALGAGPADVFRQTVGLGLRLAAIGLGLGAVAAFAASRLMRSMLFEITPADPLTYTLVAAILLVTASLASYWPARRATRVDPMTALRQE